MGVFIYLPVVLQEKFQPYIKKVLENTVEFVTDEDQKVRDTSLKVLRSLIQNFGVKKNKIFFGLVPFYFFF